MGLHGGTFPGVPEKNSTAGIISLNTTDAVAVGVVSDKPLITGAAEVEGVSRGAKGAHVILAGWPGRVDVITEGRAAQIHDYVVPSGRNNGYARAVDPNSIEDEPEPVLGKVLATYREQGLVSVVFGTSCCPSNLHAAVPRTKGDVSNVRERARSIHKRPTMANLTLEKGKVDMKDVFVSKCVFFNDRQYYIFIGPGLAGPDGSERKLTARGVKTASQKAGVKPLVDAYNNWHQRTFKISAKVMAKQADSEVSGSDNADVSAVEEDGAIDAPCDISEHGASQDCAVCNEGVHEPIQVMRVYILCRMCHRL